jgi:hypothetical protein
MSFQKNAGVPITEKPELMIQRILINLRPSGTCERGNKKQQRAPRQMEIGDHATDDPE